MQTQIFEGTLTEIQRQIASLPIKPDARLRVVATEIEGTGAEAPVLGAPTRRNGLILFPTGNRAKPVTTEFINELLNEE